MVQDRKHTHTPTAKLAGFWQQENYYCELNITPLGLHLPPAYSLSFSVLLLLIIRANCTHTLLSPYHTLFYVRECCQGYYWDHYGLRMGIRISSHPSPSPQPWCGAVVNPPGERLPHSVFLKPIKHLKHTHTHAHRICQFSSYYLMGKGQWWAFFVV